MCFIFTYGLHDVALTRLKVLQFARRRKRARGKTTESRETIKNNSVTARARGSCGFPCRLREQTSTRASASVCCLVLFSVSATINNLEIF